MSKHKHRQWGKAFINHDQPLYTSEDFIYYFENRLKTLVREEIEVLFHNMFYNAPF